MKLCHEGITGYSIEQGEEPGQDEIFTLNKLQSFQINMIRLNNGSRNKLLVLLSITKVSLFGISRQNKYYFIETMIRRSENNIQL